MFKNRRGPIAKMVGGAVDLTKEYQADRKERKAKEASAAADSPGSSASNVPAPPAPHDTEDGSSRDSSIDEQWALDLDEAQQRYDVTSSADGALPSRGAGDGEVNIDGVVQGLAARPTALSPGARNLLEMPVILPQRRPGSQHRGFVHAYAPMLSQCDVDEKAWMEFLAGLDASINANPWFHVVNAATGIAGAANSAVAGFSPMGMLVGMAVSVTLESGRKGYVRYRQNGYLDRVNDTFFKPRGLYCLIMAYKPDSAEAVAEVDLQTNAARAIEGREGQSKWKNLTSASSAATRGEAEIPASAPLVFPQLDALDEGQKANAFARFGDTLANYFDKRAATKFDGQHPGSKLAGPSPSPSAHGDSQDVPAESGGQKQHGFQGPVARVYGIHKERRAYRKQRKEQRSSKRPMKKLMTEDVLYLMVANMPTQEELDRLAAEMAQ